MIKCKVAELLEDELYCIYCHNCKYGKEENDACENCHRKYMNWKISVDAAYNIADKIDNLYRSSK